MQRQSLIPLKEFMDARGSTDGAGLSLMEVAGGTGRFATFVKVRLTKPWTMTHASPRCFA